MGERAGNPLIELWIAVHLPPLLRWPLGFGASCPHGCTGIQLGRDYSMRLRGEAVCACATRHHQAIDEDRGAKCHEVQIGQHDYLSEMILLIGLLDYIFDGFHE